MSKTDFYRQCKLKKGSLHTTSYIPEEYAIIGKILKLKDDQDNWIDGWVVCSAGDKVNAEMVEKNERLYLKTRKSSDI